MKYPLEKKLDVKSTASTQQTLARRDDPQISCSTPMASVVRLCITYVAFRAAGVRAATAAASGARGRRRRVRSVDHNLMFVMHRAKVENCSFARGSSSHFVAAAAAPADGIPHIYSVGHSESARDGVELYRTRASGELCMIVRSSARLPVARAVKKCFLVLGSH